MRVVFAGGDSIHHQALFLVLLADLARLNAFLWAEADLRVLERSTCTIQIGLGLPHLLVLVSVAADIIVGYASPERTGEVAALSGKVAGLVVAAPA